MLIGASVANSASYGTVRAPFDQCCGLLRSRYLCNSPRRPRGDPPSTGPIRARSPSTFLIDQRACVHGRRWTREERACACSSGDHPPWADATIHRPAAEPLGKTVEG